MKQPKSLRCPRCAAVIALDETGYGCCAQCHGVWSTPASNERVHPMLSWIDSSRDDAMRSPQHGTGLYRCPVCDKPARALSFFTVPIDWCPECGGVWLDGGELEALRELARPSAAMPANASPYRMSPEILQRKASLGTAVCAKCNQTVWVDMTYMTGDGVVCVPCGRKINNELPTEENAASVDRWFKGEHEREPGWISMLLDSLLGRR